MEVWEKVYLCSWLLACIVATIVIFRERKSVVLLRRAYWRFLGQRWKLVTFVISGAGVTFMGPYTTDPTWDWIDGGFMSILAFTTAPWCVATLYRFFARRERARIAFAALCLWLFSAGWSYDLYLVLRDQSYPATWSSNLILSSVLYCCAGLFWNLDWIPGRGTVLAF